MICLPADTRRIIASPILPVPKSTTTSFLFVIMSLFCFNSAKLQQALAIYLIQITEMLTNITESKGVLLRANAMNKFNQL